MNEIIKQDVTMPQVKYWNGQRVVTFKDIDEVHGRKSGTARINFRHNKRHFLEGEDYYIVKGEDVNGKNLPIGEILGKIPPKGLTLITETGYLMIVKSFTDDLSWDVQRRLVNGYFRSREMPDLIEQVSDIDQRTSNTLLPKAKTWFERNGRTLEFLCESFNVPMKTVHHKILLRLSEEYDLKEATKQFEIEKGRKPKFSLEIVDYFPELAVLATKYVNSVAKRARRNKW